MQALSHRLLLSAISVALGLVLAGGGAFLSSRLPSAWILGLLLLFTSLFLPLPVPRYVSSQEDLLADIDKSQDVFAEIAKRREQLAALRHEIDEAGILDAKALQEAEARLARIVQLPDQNVATLREMLFRDQRRVIGVIVVMLLMAGLIAASLVRTLSPWFD